MMQPFLLRLFVLLLVFAVAPALFALELTWPLPPAPPGSNPATFPAPRLEWLQRVQANFDRTKGKKFDLIFDGDSITDIWQSRGKDVWAKHYGSLNAVDFGISGDKTEHLLWRLQQGQVAGMDPKLVVLMIGTNNTGMNNPAKIAAGTEACVAEYEKRCPTAHILLLAVFPRSAQSTDPVRLLIQKINAILATDSASDKRVTYLDIGSKFLQPDGTLTADIMPDFLHPSAKGYEIWADAIQPVIDQYFPPAAAK